MFFQLLGKTSDPFLFWIAEFIILFYLIYFQVESYSETGINEYFNVI